MIGEVPHEIGLKVPIFYFCQQKSMKVNFATSNDLKWPLMDHVFNLIMGSMGRYFHAKILQITKITSIVPIAVLWKVKWSVSRPIIIELSSFSSRKKKVCAPKPLISLYNRDFLPRTQFFGTILVIMLYSAWLLLGCVESQDNIKLLLNNNFLVTHFQTGYFD